MIKDLLKNEELLKFYPAKIFVEAEESEQFKGYSNSIKTVVGTYTYTTKLVKLLTNENYLLNLLEFFKTNSSNVEICCIKNGKVETVQSYPKIVFIKIINELNEKNELTGVRNLDEILKFINTSVGLDKLKKVNQIYSCEMDGKTFAVSVQQIVDLIVNFKKLNFNSEFNVFNMNKNQFAYFIKNFSKEYSILTNYNLPENVAKFIKDIEQDAIINTSHINRINETIDPYIKQVELNPNLVDAVLRNMPKEYSQVEKAIYVYIKLCQILTYDEQFYAVGQKGEIAKRHENINRLVTITPENPSMVCYEFTEIQGKILNMLNINYELFETGDVNTYGGAHANITFKAGEFIVDADSVTSILGGDLLRAKTNKPIVGLECLNTNVNTKKEFNEILKKVHNDIINENCNPYLNNDESFNKWKEMFNSLVAEEINIKVEDKFNILNNILKNNKLPYLDKLSHAFNLSKALFKNEINYQKLKISIVKNIQNEKPLPIIVFSLKRDKNNKTKFIYKILDGDGIIKDISQDEVTRNFATQQFDYIQCESKHFVPGLDDGDERC